MITKKCQKMPNNYYCQYCDFVCSKKSNFNTHLLTAKHKKITNDNEKMPKNAEIHRYVCDCGKKYMHASGLSRHKQKCDIQGDNESFNSVITPDNKIDVDLVRDLIIQNKELQKQLFDLALTKQEISTINTNNSNTNNNNNTNNFNISVFLNEHCKNAINFNDFINNIQVSKEDLQNNAQLGFVGGISKIITDNLKLLTIHERPIHCTDLKRDTMYIRDENLWKKDKDFVQESLNRAIQEVSRKSVVSLTEWKRTNPDYADMDSDFSNLCLVMHQQSIAGYNRDKYYPKVIHRIAESVPCKGSQMA